MTTSSSDAATTRHSYQIVLRSAPPTTSPEWWSFCRTFSSALGEEVSGGGARFGGHLGHASFLLGREIEQNGQATLGSWPTEEECLKTKAWLDEKLPELQCEVRVPPKTKGEEIRENDTTNETTQTQGISHEVSDKIQRLFKEGIISEEEYEKIANVHEKYDQEVAPKGQPNDNRPIPDIYDAYARRLNPAYWANHRLYDANISYMERMSLMEFCRRFAVPQKGKNAGKIKYHKYVITKKLVFQPQYSSDPKFEGGRDYGQYCRFALVRYRPWVNAPFGRVENESGRLVEHTPPDDECIRQWKDHLLELREQMHIVPDVLLPEELKGGGAGIELLVVPVVDRADVLLEGEQTKDDINDRQEDVDEDEEEEMDETSICLSYVMKPGDDEDLATSNLSTEQGTVQPITKDQDQSSETASQDNQRNKNQSNNRDEESADDDAQIGGNILSHVKEEDAAALPVEDGSPPRNATTQLADNDSPRGMDEELYLSEARKNVESSEVANPSLFVSHAFETDQDHQFSILQRRSSWAESLRNINSSFTEVKPDPQGEEVDSETACSTSSDKSFVQSSWDEASFGACSANSGDSIRATPSEPPAAPWSLWDEASFGAHPADTSNPITEANTLVAKETLIYSQESGWETFGNVDFHARNEFVTTDVWNTSRSFFMAPPSSPTRRLAPSRRDRASSPCRSPIGTSSAQALLDKADAIIQKADRIDREYQGVVSQVYKKLQDAKEEKDLLRSSSARLEYQ